MNADDLKAMQAPLKDLYKTDPASALITLRARGRATDGIACKVETGKALVRPVCIRPRVAMDPSPVPETCSSKL